MEPAGCRLWGMGEGNLTTSPVTGPAAAAAAAHAPPLSPSGEARPLRRPAKRKRVLIGDARGNTRYLRTTWHRETNVFVVSTWTDEVCTGSVRVPVEQAPELIGLLADGLGEAASYAAPAETPSSETSPRVADRLLNRLGLVRKSPRRESGSASRRQRSRAASAVTGATIHKLR